MNKKMLRLTVLIFLVVSATTAELAFHYDKPAQNWEKEALPIGNGRLGAMIFGDIDREHIQDVRYHRLPHRSWQQL